MWILQHKIHQQQEKTTTETGKYAGLLSTLLSAEMDDQL